MTSSSTAPKIDEALISAALKKGLADAMIDPAQKHALFLRGFSTVIESVIQEPYRLEQKNATDTERLYDICVFELAAVVETGWKLEKPVMEVRSLVAAIEIENRQGPRYTYEDLWKVIFARADYRVFCGGIKSGGYGNGSGDSKVLMKERLKAIQSYYGPGNTNGLIVGFYPHPDEWTAGKNLAEEVCVTSLPQELLP